MTQTPIHSCVLGKSRPFHCTTDMITPHTGEAGQSEILGFPNGRVLERWTLRSGPNVLFKQDAFPLSHPSILETAKDILAPRGESTEKQYLECEASVCGRERRCKSFVCQESQEIEAANTASWILKLARSKPKGFPNHLP